MQTEIEERGQEPPSIDNATAGGGPRDPDFSSHEKRVAITVTALLLVCLAAAVANILQPSLLPGVWSWIDEQHGVAAWMQGLGTIAAVFYAGRIAVMQHRMDEGSRLADRQVFAAAFGLRLKPQLQSAVHYLRRAREGLAEQLATKPADATHGVEYNHSISDAFEFIRSNWENVARSDHQTAIALIRATSAVEAAAALIHPDDVFYFDHNPEEGPYSDIGMPNAEIAHQYLTHIDAAITQLDTALAALTHSNAKL